MPVEFQNAGNKITALLIGELDHHSAEPMRTKIDKLVRREKPDVLCLDFSQITFMDSSGVGLVMGRYRVVKPYGGRLELSGMSSTVRRVMRLSGIDKIATVTDGKEV